MEKLLTISIAAYNVEKYIRRALDSLMIPELMDKLEVLIIDDGGTDSTLSIAKEYESKYPETYKTVHKENEGYGSTVNYSIKNAQGKFFKLLDGDDWFDREGLKDLIYVLNELNNDVDVLFTGVNLYYDENGNKIFQDILNQDGEFDLSSFSPNRNYSMWFMTFRTRILRECRVELPTHSLYTDQYLNVIPFMIVRRVRFESVQVYCYLAEREGQSNSLMSVTRHYKEAMEVNRKCCEYYSKNINNANREFIYWECLGIFRHVIRILFYLPANKDNERLIKEYDQEIKDISKDIYYGLKQTRWKRTYALLKICRLTNYRVYMLLKLLIDKKKWKTT